MVELLRRGCQLETHYGHRWSEKVEFTRLAPMWDTEIFFHDFWALEWNTHRCEDEQVARTSPSEHCPPSFS